MIKQLRILWNFSRPHTIIGSIVSMTVLWLIALESNSYSAYLSLWIWTLVAGIACNIFIVGLNQIVDVELDKINKPHLPLADGSLSIRSAYFIIIISLAITLFFSFLTSIILGWLIVTILLIGISYSVPPIQLKRHHVPAAISITLVRGILVNIGMFLHFSYVSGSISLFQIQTDPILLIPENIWMLTSFVVAFSVAIAWFKDLPDTDGDAQFRFNTLAIVYSPKMALYGGIALVSLAYISTIIWSFSLGNNFLSICHLITFLLFLVNVGSVDLIKPKTVTRFYMIFWVFFFLEYIFFGINTFL